MGCCETKNKNLIIVEDKIKEYIEQGNLSSLRSIHALITKSDKDFDINTILYPIDETLSVCPLGLSLLLGHADIFKAILQEMNGDFSLMESQFSEAETSGLSIICLNNYLVLLQVYLPLFLNSKKEQNLSPKTKNTRQTIYLDAKEELEQILPCTYTPIQLAVENGHISIVNLLRSFVCSLNLIPSEIDLNYIEENTGNNSALIACKENDFKMIKFLHCQCQADFNIVNNFSENAINILAIGSKNKCVETFKCLEYLIEKIQVDLVYNYQETLMMLEEPEALGYFEKKLCENGINVTKKDLELQGMVKPQKKTVCVANETGNRFTFTRIFPELIKTPKESMLSSDNFA
ncbi:hypothetical protein SteCoe_14556 [Stentor coeruleus]|uniref:Uncharacterized protein n=1 Tax=Stentor coeruleus TaxID=5963 RepID=A0A1R2C5M8_9CILI|nr:hypothetical protein SteCoe_14556 [Stentor coeruleus]